MNQRPQSFALTVDGGLFSIGFAVGVLIGRFVLRNTLLAVAFGTGLGLAVGTSPRLNSSASGTYLNGVGH